MNVNTPCFKNENENESFAPFATQGPCTLEPFEHFEHNVNEKHNELVLTLIKLNWRGNYDSEIF